MRYRNAWIKELALKEPETDFNDPRSNHDLEDSCCLHLHRVYIDRMSTIDAATFKAKAEELLAKALQGDVTIIDKDGKRAVLMPCAGAQPDFQLYPETDQLLLERLQTPGREPTDADWEALARGIPRE